jgi:hypothetical protein
VSEWTYDVQVVGEVDDDVLDQVRAEFGDVSVTVQPASTLIRSSVPDQAGLIGMLMRLQDFGLSVREVHYEDEPEDPPGHGHPER